MAARSRNMVCGLSNLRPCPSLFKVIVNSSRIDSEGTTKDCYGARYFSSAKTSEREPTTTADHPPLSARWLSDLKARIGKCIFFGLTQPQIDIAARILRTVATDWQTLVAGSEGYLTTPDRAGLVKHRVTWGDMDCMSHVNNVVYNKWAETARIEWANCYAVHLDPAHAREWTEMWTPRGDGMILRSIRTDYKFPMTWPDRVSVYHKLRAAPTAETDSFVLDVILLSERMQRAAARCVEDIVVYDYRAGKKQPLKPFMVHAFAQTFKLQELAKKQCGERVRSLLAEVRHLELASWDCDGAVEDMGSSTTGS